MFQFIDLDAERKQERTTAMTRFLKPSYEILTNISEGGINELKLIEKIGRVAYQSENRITEDGESAKNFIRMLIRKGHTSVLEHSSLSVLFICSRAVSHELVRHRICSFTQESQRYVNYDKKGVPFIMPLQHDSSWILGMEDAAAEYEAALSEDIPPEYARECLPNSTKTEIGVTANYREWRHILKLRTAPDAHPEMRRLMVPLLHELQLKIPVVFDDIVIFE